MSKLQSRGAAAGTILVAALLLAAGTAQADKCTSLQPEGDRARRRPDSSPASRRLPRRAIPRSSTDCEDKVIAKFSTSFAKSGTCSGVQADSETIADDCRDKVRAALPDGTATASKCEATRLKAAGKKAEKKLLCYSKAAKKGVAVDSAVGGCLDKASALFVKSFDKVTGCTGDGQTASVETIVDTECVTQPVATLAVCGNMNVDNGEQCDPPGSSCGGTAVCGNDCTCPCTVDTCPCDFLDPSVCLYPVPERLLHGRGFEHRHRAARELPARRHAEERVARLHGSDALQPATTASARARRSSPACRASISRRPAPPPITDLARSLDPDAPIVIVNTNTLEHHLLFAELDANAHDRRRSHAHHPPRRQPGRGNALHRRASQHEGLERGAAHAESGLRRVP